MTTEKKLTVGVVPLMLALYDRLAPDLRGHLQAFSQEVAAGLSGEALDVRATGLVVRHEELAAALDECEGAGCDLVVLAHLSYAPSGQFIAALEGSDLPLLVWPVQPMERLDPQTYDRAGMLRNHGVHGAQDLANMLRRRRVPHGVLHGHWQDAAVRAALLSWAQAGRAVRAMRGANPVVLGGRFADMLDLQLDDEAFVAGWGLRAGDLSPHELLAAAKALAPAASAERVGAYRDKFDIDEKVSDAMLAQAAGLELALRACLEQHDSRAVGINFLEVCNHPDIGDSLHVAASMLMNDGYGYGGEGDWTTAMLLRGLLAGQLPATFTEIFSVGYADNRLVLRHWGEANFALARSRPRVRASVCSDRRRAEFAVLDFEFAPGPATLLNLNADPDGRGQIITVDGVVTEDHLPAVDGPRGVFRPAADNAAALLTDYARHGGSHHLVMVRGPRRELAEKIADLTGWIHLPE